MLYDEERGGYDRSDICWKQLVRSIGALPGDILGAFEDLVVYGGL